MVRLLAVLGFAASGSLSLRRGLAADALFKYDKKRVDCNHNEVCIGRVGQVEKCKLDAVAFTCQVARHQVLGVLEDLPDEVGDLDFDLPLAACRAEPDQVRD